MQACGSWKCTKPCSPVPLIYADLNAWAYAGLQCMKQAGIALAHTPACACSRAFCCLHWATLDVGNMNEAASAIDAATDPAFAGQAPGTTQPPQPSSPEAGSLKLPNGVPLAHVRIKGEPGTHCIYLMIADWLATVASMLGSYLEAKLLAVKRECIPKHVILVRRGFAFTR